MNDQPQVDNPQKPNNIESTFKKNNFSQLESKQPGPESGSTPLDLKELSSQQEGENDRLVKALMQGIQNENPPTVVDKKLEPKMKDLPKKNISQQRGFLMPIVNGFNGVINGIWGALGSLIPMKK